MKKRKKSEKSGLYIAICCCAVIIAAVGYAGRKDVDNEEEIVQNIRNDEVIVNDIIEEQGFEEYIAEDIEIIQTPVINPEPTIAAPKAEVPVAKTIEVEELTFKIPVDGRVVCEFSGDKLLYNDTLSDWRTHNGIDISCDKDAAVYAAEKGTVKNVYDDSMGKNVVIEHSDGYLSVYANMSDRIEVEVGQEIAKGDLIGKVGNTALGDFTTDAHLHFELLKDGKYVNPVDYIE